MQGSQFTNVIKSCLVVGGCGFLGSHLATYLTDQGCDVKVFDITYRQNIKRDVQFVQGNVTDLKALTQACHGVDCVFYCVSIGFRPQEKRLKEKIERVNIGGTENIIQACLEQNVRYLVYTSTGEVYFSGQAIRNGDEKLPYARPECMPYTDYYTMSKIKADQLVLAANGVRCNDNTKLRTCSIRTSGLYGEGEDRLFPIFIENVRKSGIQINFSTEGGNNLLDFTYIGNSVKCHYLAAVGLTEVKDHIAAGQAYNATDGKPQNPYKFLTNVVDKLGYSYSTITIPFAVLIFIVRVLEIACDVYSRFVSRVEIGITLSEIYLGAVSVYFSSEKASKHLGYQPDDKDIDEVVEYYRANGYACQQRSKQRSNLYWLVIVSIVVGLCFIYAYL